MLQRRRHSPRSERSDAPRERTTARSSRVLWYVLGNVPVKLAEGDARSSAAVAITELVETACSLDAECDKLSHALAVQWCALHPQAFISTGRVGENAMNCEGLFSPSTSMKR